MRGELEGSQRRFLIPAGMRTAEQQIWLCVGTLQ